MKKLSMFGFAFLLMFVGIFSSKALDISYSLSSGDESKITYSIGDGESLSYQIVRLTKEEYEKVEGAVSEAAENAEPEDMLSKETLAKLEELQTKLAEAETTLEQAKTAYKSDASEENKSALDEAQSAYDEANNMVTNFIFTDAMADIFKFISNTVAQYVPYDEQNWTPYTDKTGEITIDNASMEDGYVYVLWLKGVDNTTGTPVEFTTLGGMFEKNDGQIVKPEIPELSTDVNTPSQTTNNVKNPKTGVVMPIALGASVIVIAGLSLVIIRKKQLFKQL